MPTDADFDFNASFSVAFDKSTTFWRSVRVFSFSADDSSMLAFPVYEDSMIGGLDFSLAFQDEIESNFIDSFDFELEFAESNKLFDYH